MYKIMTAGPTQVRENVRMAANTAMGGRNAFFMEAPPF